MFHPADVSTFRITNWTLDHRTGAVELHYSFDDMHHFVEHIGLPATPDASAAKKDALERAVRLLHLVAGVSYFKAAAPNRISIETGPISSEVLTLLRKLYGEGLAEFAYENRMPIPRPEFDVEVESHGNAPAAELSDHALVAVGGGKDSCVSIELLRDAEIPITLASVNRPRAITETIDRAQIPAVQATRKLSDVLFRLNDDAALNGHVPVTAIVSVLLTALAITADANAVVMSNERSASVGNLEYDGVVINHQYSKSFEVEQMLARIIREDVASDVDYFSLLRPMSELTIAKRFASTTRYDNAFTSCNRAFRIDASRRIDHWCCDCPKCRFVFLALAPFVEPQRLIDIFGKNMLDDPLQFDGFDTLIGWEADKPFECVGEVEESIAAFVMLRRSPQWQNFAVVARFDRELLPNIELGSDLLTSPFVLSDKHGIPERFVSVLGSQQ